MRSVLEKSDPFFLISRFLVVFSPDQVKFPFKIKYSIIKAALWLFLTTKTK